MNGSRYPLEVRPRLPRELARLEELSGNLVYSWDRRVRALFYHLDPVLWERCRHNPKVFLRRVAQERLDARVRDRDYMRDYGEALRGYDAYLAATDPANAAADGIRPGEDVIAYFCMEYGLHESLKLYSGGLGVLAGDHCKAASDTGLPFVAVGLMYRQGYFEQTIDAAGVQHSHFHPMALADLPIAPVTNGDGSQHSFSIRFPGRDVAVRAWRVDIGHVRLFLLDTDCEGNRDEDRSITYQLYGGDRQIRLGQEMVLGIGGVRLLRTLGIAPTVWHMNEGHAAFSALERCREEVERGLDFESALEKVAANTVFTTHTPVPAGHDMFPRDMFVRHFEQFAAQLGVPMQRVLALGASPQDASQFNMTSLALRVSRHHNGVSEIHGRVASEMESYAWPEIDPEDNPLEHVTNGVHVPTYIARDWVNLFDARHPGWTNRLLDPPYWREVVDQMPDHLFWSLRQSMKAEMLAGVRDLLLKQYRRNRIGRARTDQMVATLSPDNTRPLVIGFARRFATYKRAVLLFNDRARLSRLLNDPERPVIVLFAGKAHPQDGPGQDMIRRINEFAAEEDLVGKLFFIEDYDLTLARKLVTGSDVWLNTPQYPLEASGTSGQKAAMNGVLNLSVLDGWWPEAFDGDNGWGIPPHDDKHDPHERDRLEADELLDLLERDVVPTFFDHGPMGYSERWVGMSKHAMATILPRFSAHRMVMDYVNRLYVPAIQDGKRIDDDAARALAAWKQRVRERWRGVSLRWHESPPGDVRTGERIVLTAVASLNGLEPGDVCVEALVEADGEQSSETCRIVHPFQPAEDGAHGDVLYRVEFTPPCNGLLSLRVHAYPHHEYLSHPFEVGLRRWL